MAASSDKYLLATLSISQCVTLKLNDTNYLPWKLQVEQFLYSQELLGYVSGEVPCPSQTITTRSEGTVSEASNPDYQKWVRTDRMIMAWLFGSLSEETLKTVYGLKTSQEVWLYLAKQFNRVSTTRRLDIQRRIQTTVKGTKTLAQYLSEIKSLCDQLDSIGSPLSEQEKIYGILNGIGREYESIATVIENSMDSLPTLCYEDVVFKLTNFDDKLQKYEAVTEELKREMDRMVKKIDLLEIHHRKLMGQGLGSCSVAELQEIDTQIEKSLRIVRSRKAELYADQLVKLKEKERELLNERKRLHEEQIRERLMRPVVPLTLRICDKGEAQGGCRTEHSSEVETDLFIGLPVTRL